MKGIVIAGTVLVDNVKIIEAYPSPTMLTTIVSESKAVGGVVSNTSITLKRIDPSLDVRVLGLIGDDSFGDYIKKVFNEEKLDISLLKVSNVYKTAYSDVMTELNGRRTFFVNKGCNSYLDEAYFDALNGENTMLCHIGYLLLLDALDQKDEEYGTKMARLLHSLQKRNIKTSIDLVSEESHRFKDVVLPSLKYCDYVIINEIEAGRIFDIPPRDEKGNIIINNIKEILKLLKKSGVKGKAIIHCPELGALINENDEITIVPSLLLPKSFIKGTVGAGDAFCAGALFGIVKKYSDDEILKIASCTAAINLTAIDSISAGVSLKETLELLKNYERKKI